MAGDIHLKLDGIDGESEIKGFEKQIDIDSVRLGAHMQGTAARGGGLAGGKGEMQDVVLMKQFDVASPKLFEKCIRGAHIDKAEITLKKAGDGAQTYLTITLDHVLVKEVSFEGADNGGNPMETVPLHFDKINMDYKPQQIGGTLGGVSNFNFSQKANS